jgi:response regulator RpfG family c-di-GMP phosphodiesterase
MSQKIRLDQILQREGLVTDSQIQDALLRQKKQGGKFGSQLLYHRYIDEPGLVKALGIQFGCEGVVLANLDIPESVIRIIPSKLALTRMVLPFEYDPKTLVLKVACENPQDSNLITELNFVAPGKKIKLYVAAELALETTINKYYLGRDADLNDKLLVEIPDLNISSEQLPERESPELKLDKFISEKQILILTDEEYTGGLVESILSRDGFEVTLCDTIEKAGELIVERNFQTAFIKLSVDGDINDLVTRIKKGSPRTDIKLFHSAAGLLTYDDSFFEAEDILKKNLDLFTSLLALKDNLSDNHSSRVGKYADKLCHKLGLPPKDRLTIVSAAFLHDLAKHFASAGNDRDSKTIIDSSKKLLEYFGYSNQVSEMLHLMYADLDMSTNPPLEILGGNILTIVDLFWENILFDEKFTLEKFDAFKKRARDFSGKLFLPEVIEAFIAMVQEEILNFQTAGSIGRIQIFSNDSNTTYPLLLRLNNEGYHASSQNLTEMLPDNLKSMRPDILILFIKGESGEVKSAIANLFNGGLDPKLIPTILMTENQAISKLASLFESGIEDVISVDANFEILIAKIHKIQAQLEQRAKQKAQSAIGAHGRLADMNLIDLMQALAPGRRTVKITLSQIDSGSDKLIIYLDKGNIIHASLGVKTGADAIYEGMVWPDGTWSVEPIKPDKLPAPNSTASNDSILMEGAYRLDEKMRAGKLR